MAAIFSAKLAVKEEAKAKVPYVERIIDTGSQVGLVRTSRDLIFSHQRQAVLVNDLPIGAALEAQAIELAEQFASVGK